MHIHKYILWFLSLVLFLTAACTMKSDTAKDGNFHIKVTIDNISDGTKVLLKKQVSNVMILKDSTFVYNHEFDFKGTIETPAMFGIYIDSLRGGIFPLVESGTINISVHRDSLDAVIISGSKLNDELEKFKEGSQKIVSKINDLFIQTQKARAENDLEKINEINNKMRAINDENTRYSLDYAKNNPDSFISSIILQSLLRIPEVDINEVRSIYTSFSEDVKKSEYSKNIFAILESKQPQKENAN